MFILININVQLFSCLIVKKYMLDPFFDRYASRYVLGSWCLRFIKMRMQF